MPMIGEELEALARMLSTSFGARLCTVPVCGGCGSGGRSPSGGCSGGRSLIDCPLSASAIMRQIVSRLSLYLVLSPVLSQKHVSIRIAGSSVLFSTYRSDRYFAPRLVKSPASAIASDPFAASVCCVTYSTSQPCAEPSYALKCTLTS